MHPDRFDRYLKVSFWLKKRYTRAGWLTVQNGQFMSLYAALDYAAFRRYLG